MIIIAIDPGYDRLGIAVLEKPKNQKEIILYSECVQTPATEDFNIRLGIIGKKVRAIIEKYKPEYMAIESLFFSNNTKTALKVSESKGVVIFQAIDKNISVYEFTPNQIKVAVTGYGKATKKDMHTMTSRLINLDGKKMIDDEIDAVAIGLTFYATFSERTSRIG
jgi:crossover junction endodeoxyribonuclease RuvC